jgi:serine/threonine protein kinase
VLHVPREAHIHDNASGRLQGELQAQLQGTLALERELPRGGMSRVFVATEIALGRQVVLKVLAPELTATLSAERFKREISLAARLQHPSIVPLLSAGQAGGRLYYTMPLVDGDSLREEMARQRPMSIDHACRILEDVASALAYAHDQGIVHRDIKPENIMFVHGRAVVLDFGIGKAVDAAQRNDGDIRITQAGVSLGTPTYIAPEQAQGDPALDHRADLYALGVVAYEMLTGHPPFAGRSAQAVMKAHARDIPQPVLSRRPDVPARMAEVVMRCLAKKPADRPDSAREIVAALHAPVPAPQRVPSWVPWLIAAVSTLVALALAVRR